MAYSIDGYKRNSKDVNNPYNVIPSGDITMKGVDFPVMGTDNLGNQQLMQPGFDYQFPGSQVFEQPMQNPTQDIPKNEVKKRKVDRDNKLIKNWTPEMGDVSSHLMTSMQFTDDDGSPLYVVIPMLFPTIEGQETPDPASWTQFAKGDEMNAFEMAMTRGEVYYFNSAEEADKFSKGSWKTPNLKKRVGGSLPKAQWWNPANAYRGVKNLLGIGKNIKGLQYPKGGLTHRFTNAPKFPMTEEQGRKSLGLLDNFQYKTFPDWQRYVAATQPINTNFQLPSLLSGDMLSLTNNKNLINTNSLSSYINKTKGLNSIQLYDRQKMKTVFDNLNLGSERFVDKDLFIGEVGKTINPQLIIPSITSLPMKSNTLFNDLWEGADNPFKSLVHTNENPLNYTGAIPIPMKKNPHVLQTFIPNTPTVPMYDLSVGASHYDPIQNPRSSGKEGGLTLGHNRIMFDPNYPKTTVLIEKQADYAQKYNQKNPTTGEGAFDEYLRVLKVPNDPPTTKTRDNFIELRDAVGSTIYRDGDLTIKNILQKEANEGLWADRILHEQIKDFWNGATPNEIKKLDLNIATDLSFNELNQNSLLQIVKTPEFKVHMDNKVKYFEQVHVDDLIKHEKQILINQKELYNIENPSELSLKLKDYKKNAQVILLNELVDYSTKLGNTHVHLPLAETVAKTQGYDANKWGAPNPLYTQHKWTGHNWNDFNEEIKRIGDYNETATHGLFQFKAKKNPSKEIHTFKDKGVWFYKNPTTGKEVEIKDLLAIDDSKTMIFNNQDVLNKIESLRNEFLTSKGYNPEVDYKGDMGAYKPEYQTILSKSTEKQHKKDIEQLFGKDYSYEIITDAHGNKYIRLDHTGTRQPIKNLHTYKYGGSLTKYQDSGQLPKAQFGPVGKGLRWLMSPFSKRARAAHYKDLLKTKPTNFDVRGMNEASINFDPTKTFVPELNLSGANLGNLTNFEKFQLNKQLSTAVDNPEFSYLLQNYGLLNTPEYATRLGDFAANNPDSRIGLNIGNSLRIPKGGIRLNDGTQLGQNPSFPGVSGTYNESIANEMYENQVAEVLNKGIVPNNMMQTFQGKTTHQFDPDLYGTEFYVKPGWGYPSFKGNKGGLVYAGKTEEEVRRNLLDNYFEYRKPEYNKSLLTSITNNPNLVDISDKQSLLDANRNLTDAQRSWDYLSSEKTKNLESYGGTGLLFQDIGGKDFMINKGLMNPDPLSNITRYVNRSSDFTGPQHNYMLFQGRPNLILSGDKGYVGPSGDREYTTGLPNPQANTEVPIQNEPMYNYLTQQFELNKPIDGTFIRYKDGGSLAKAQDGKEQKWTDEQLYKWLELQNSMISTGAAGSNTEDGVTYDPTKIDFTDSSTWPGAYGSVADGTYNTLYDWLPDMSTQKGRSEAYNLHRAAVAKFPDYDPATNTGAGSPHAYWGPDPSGGDKAYPYINENVSEKEERTGDFKNYNDALAFAKKYNLNPLSLSVEGKPFQDITQYNSGDPKSIDISNMLYDANYSIKIDELYKQYEKYEKEASKANIDNFLPFEQWVQKRGGLGEDYVPDIQLVNKDNYENAIKYSGNTTFEGSKFAPGPTIGTNTGNEYITLDGEQVKNPMFVDQGRPKEMTSIMGLIPAAVGGAGLVRAGFAGLAALMRVPIPGTAGALNLGNVANTGFAGHAMINTFPEAYRDYKKEDYGSMAKNLGWGALEMLGIGNTGVNILPKTFSKYASINPTLPAFNPYGKTAFMNVMNKNKIGVPTFNINPFSKSPSQWDIMKNFAGKDFSKYVLNPAYAAPKFSTHGWKPSSTLMKKYGGQLPKAQKGVETIVKGLEKFAKFRKNELQLSSLFKGNKFEGALSKSGHVSIPNLLQYVDKQSKFESAFVREQLKDFPQFQGKIDFNKFKVHLNTKLIPMMTEDIRNFRHNDMGMGALGYDLYNPATLDELFPTRPPEDKGKPYQKFEGVDKINTITFRNKYFGSGSDDHFNKFTRSWSDKYISRDLPGVYGHNRYFSTIDKPLEANLLEVQSDWGQQKHTNWIFDTNKLKKQQAFSIKRSENVDRNLNLYEKETERNREVIKILKEIEFAEGQFDVNMVKQLNEKLDIAESMHEGWLSKHTGWSIGDYTRALTHSLHQLELTRKKKLDLVTSENLLQSELVKRNMDTRVLTETIQDLISKGYTSMNLPSWQVAAKIQGHDKGNWLLSDNATFGKMLDNFGQSKIVNEEWKISDRLGRLKMESDGSVIDITNNKVIFSIPKFFKENPDYAAVNPNNVSWRATKIVERDRVIKEYRRKLQDKNTNELIDYEQGHQRILRKYRDLFPKLLKNKFKLDFNTNTDKFKNDWKNYKFKPKWLTGEGELPALEEGGEISSVYKEGYESLKDNREIVADMMDNGAFLPKFKYGSEKQIEGILGRYNIKKEYDDTKNLPYVSYETESPGTFYDRIYYSGDDKKGNDDFSIIDMSSQIREQRIEHDRTKKLITAYDNNEEISKSGLDHLRNLGMLNTKKEKEEVIPSFAYKEPVVSIPLEQIKVSSDLRNKTNKEDKGIPVELQIEFYMAYVNGLFIGTEKEEKLKKIYDKLNRVYYNDARKSNMSVIDYMKSLNN